MGGNTKKKNDLTCWTSMESNLPDKEEEKQFICIFIYFFKIEFGNSKKKKRIWELKNFMKKRDLDSSKYLLCEKTDTFSQRYQSKQAQRKHPRLFYLHKANTY